MLSTKEVQSLLNGSTSYRGDCPICGGRNSFSASITQGDVAWICFKASCSERGRDYSTRSVEQIVTALLRSSLSIPTNDFIIHDYFTGIEHKDNAIKFFKRLHILPLYNEGRLKLRYDPKQDRAVFLIERGGKVVDAMGRSLSNSLTKWFRYGNSSKSFLLRRSAQTIVITEDIPSACVASYTHSAMGLLGTEVSDDDMKDLLTFNKVIVALDPDAYSKGILIANRLKPFVDARAILIPDDLKYFEPSKVKEIINEY